MKYLFVLSSHCLLGCFLGIGLLGFSEFRHVTRKLYQIVRCSLPPKMGVWEWA